MKIFIGRDIMKTPNKTEYNSVPPPVQFAMRPSVPRPYLQNDALWLCLLRNPNRKPRAGSLTHWPAYTATGSIALTGGGGISFRADIGAMPY